ncbi:beta-ketoacyl-acyl carrier protein reductase [Weissella viridescens]|uniref:3-oxoacyl-[acyl-carrier-protein] reductase n=2 Tax=Weissella viridescens TaxID=1629 RepID=A0A0R2H0V8_WEIVI|nr:3-oxoacyl-[acyl-carrier-protein] reductase [Weissella viridescens]KRN46142.1 3-oxoacyl-[acyl-carrier-protein] reductase [Weissella viridescens]MBX4172640.1 3-oxoacyl-[acyl-carrier-protein] reductase [Weissella viridescens]MCB6840443.1 3-oxoacyl-[acyl-carrier-protein] reductase [Weissella viridescens]MCB6847176.1 3-oxoacyl-[acyl-carrier-protein] reductase [Weissella viridescens]QOD86601.1 3-oxoacyl-[acyl-carrier-protein] reductase [Weissella viridescens]
MDLKNKNVLVTGSTRGIGLAIAKRFSQLGANVILHGRSQPSETVLADFPEGTPVILGDIADADTIQPVIQALIEEVGQIDVLVNNAGIVKDTLAIRMSSADFAQVVDTNLTGTFNVTQPVFKHMLKKRTGAIINLSSIVGLHGNMGQANYAASKAGLIGLTKSLAKEGASRGIRVNAIAPGMIDSDMTSQLSEKVQANIKDAIPLKRLGNADEIAQTAQFLIENDYVTGETITVDGGLSL